MKTLVRNRKTILLVLITFLQVSISEQAVASGEKPARSPAERLQQQVARYAEIVRNGGWTNIAVSKKQYKKGDSAPAIRQLKQRLVVSGDFSGKDTSLVFTPELEEAVRTVQQRFGFPQNGVVDAALIKTLNVPASYRLQQLQVNVYRAQSSPAATAGKRVVVNIPEYKLRVYEDGLPVLEMNVVVGKPASKTAVFDDELTHIVFSPYWNVPAGIVRNEIIPAMRKRKNYLEEYGYEVIGNEGGLPKIRQRPGINNSLGLVKFLFPNEHDIYFHDTPAKGLFANRNRAFSHGCIRLEEPERLAEYLLKDAAAWTPAKISMAMYEEKETWVKMEVPVPVSITYFTAWVDEAGTLNFRDDIYGLDKSIALTASNK